MTKSILLCDDEIPVLRAAEFKFQHAGYDVRTAGDGEEGWEAILARKPDIVITDCQMPRLDGFGLVRRIRENPATADLPVLMLTAKGFELNRDELMLQWNVLDVIGKPFSPRGLLQRVEAILEAVGSGKPADGAGG